MRSRLAFLSHWRVERRTSVSARITILSRLLAVVLAFAVAGVVVELAGMSSISLFSKAFGATFGSFRGIQQLMLLATPITLTGFAVIIGMKMGVWNIGIEGQFLVGAFGAAVAGLYIPAPPVLSLVLMFVGGGLAGALWILVPALARAYRGANELITTLLLNFVALSLVMHFAAGPMRDRELGGHLATPKLPNILPTLFGTRLHIGIFIPVIIAVALNLALRHTRWGYQLTIMGGNRRASEYAGMPVARYTFTTLLLSGALAGIAGMIELAGTTYRLSGTISPGYGYVGFLIAALANFEPVIMLVAGIVYAAILNGGIALKTQGLSVHFVVAITGLILLLATIGEALSRYRIVRRAPAEGVSQKTPSLEAEASGSHGRSLQA